MLRTLDRADIGIGTLDDVAQALRKLLVGLGCALLGLG